MKNFYEKGMSYVVRLTYLKGILLAIFLLGMGVERIDAQVNAYLFSQSNGTFTKLTGGTVLATATGNSIGAPSLDSGVFPVTLPFAFNFNGTNYTEINVSANGFLTFGTTSPGATSTPISATTAYDGAISAWGRDINTVFNIAGVTGDIRWDMVGTAPNREIVVQWSNFRPTYSTSTTAAYTLSFQIRLKEMGNIISVVYSGGAYLVGTTSYSAVNLQVGLRGATNADFNIRTNPATELFVNSTAGTANNKAQSFSTVDTPSGMPPVGLTYTWTPATCWPPVNFTTSNITTTSADFMWNAPATVPANGYDVYYNTTGVSPDASTVLTASNSLSLGSAATSASITGLSAGSNYYVWIRSNCSAGNSSMWVFAQLISTACAPITYMYENFDTYAAGSIVPICWDRIISGSGSQTISTSTPFSAPNNIYQYSSTATNSTIVVLPEFSNINAGTHWLRFKAKASTVVAATALEVGYVTDATSASSFVLLQTVPILETSYGLDYKIQVPTSVPANARLAIRNPGATTASYYWDDVYWEPTPSCLPPTNIALTGVTAYGAQVSWTAPTTPVGTGYDVYIDTTNTAPTAATVPTVSSATSPATLQNLTPVTTYYVWVRSNCGSGDLSEWIQIPVSFLTLCAPVATLFEGFDSYGTGDIVPNCWVRLAPTAGAGSQSISSTAPASGSRNIYQNASTSQTPVIVVLPEFSNVNAGTHWLRFQAKVSTLPGALEVGYVTDVTDANTFVNLTTLDITNTAYNGTYYTVQIPTWVSANARLAIRNSADGKSYYWDDVYWEAVPTCFAPTNPMLTAASFTSLDFSWTAPVGSPTPVQGYEYYISTSNTPPTSATVPSGTSATTSASITTNLLPETVYYIWVRSVCSATDRSDWSGVLKATTGYCVPSVGTATSYYLATMNTTGATTNLNYTASSYSPYVNNAATSIINAYPTQSFDIFLDGSGSSTYYYYVWVDWNNNMSFEDAGERIIAPTSTAYLTSLSETLTIPAGTPYGSYRVRVGMSFSGVIDSSCGSGRSGNFVDLTLNVGAPPTCVEPTNIQVSNVTHNSATIGWVASTTPPAMGYDIYYSATNTPPTATSVPQVQNAPGLSADITGLAPITTYYVWVRSHCSGTDQSFWTSVPVTVATLCQPPSITGTTSSTSATPMCMNDTATLTATADAGANITWYDAPTGGTAVGTGATFTTPALAASTNYYAAASFGGTQSAALTNATSTSGYTLEAGLFFDASASFVLEGVYVYPIGTGAGDVVIALQNGNVSPAVTLQTVTVTLTGSGAPYVKTFVPLNFNIVPGTNYKLMMMSRSGGVASLVRESGSAWGTYPLTVPSVFSITNGNCCSNNDISASYYYFYDWQISTKCEGARVPVAVDVNTGCSLSTSEITKDDRSIMVYPNPFTDVINISDAKSLKSVTVMDASGRMVKTIANPGAQIHLGELKSGLYLLKLSYADGNTKTVKVIKR